MAYGTLAVSLAIILCSWRLNRILPRSKSGRSNLDRFHCSLAVFLGSGGHTSEALTLISALDFSKYCPRIYIVSEGDSLSAQKARALEMFRNPSSSDFSFVIIPRARRVHQSLLTTPFTSAVSFLACLHQLWPLQANFADAMLLNGPGTCFVLCLAAYVYKFLGLHSPMIIYVETFARTKSASLSGRLLQPLADRFITQWPNGMKPQSKCLYWLV